MATSELRLHPRGATLAAPALRPDAPAWRAAEGRLASIETAGTVDGPGLRFVAFLAGCPLRCLYCHNPEATEARNGRITTAGELVDEVAAYARFLRPAGGGVTASGGEPLQQPAFVEAFFRGARELGLTTALDTSGFLGRRATDALLDLTDLVLLDIKSWETATHERVTGAPLRPTLDFAERLAARGTPVWIRFVLVPGLTDAPQNIAGVADFVAGLPNVERVEVLPFHKMGEPKWDTLGRAYRLAATPAATPAQAERARDIFRARGIPTF
jgi:pyruvate formate lyase activating enzyme